MWEMEELQAKTERIKKLKHLGFNTPLMFHIPQWGRDKIEKGIAWAIANSPRPYANIRTYTREGKKEGLNKKHYTDVPISELRNTLHIAIINGHCMIDLEWPDNGRWAGNVVVLKHQIMDRPERYMIEFCKRDIRAMVRNADKHIEGYIHEYQNEPLVLKTVVAEALKFPEKEVVLEWTWFGDPAGIKKENLVWWEFRKWVT